MSNKHSRLAQALVEPVQPSDQVAMCCVNMYYQISNNEVRGSFV